MVDDSSQRATASTGVRGELRWRYLRRTTLPGLTDIWVQPFAHKERELTMDELTVLAPGDALGSLLMLILYIPLQLLFAIINLWTGLANAS